MHQGLAWALDHDPPAALRLALALAPWWLMRGRWVQGYALLQRAASHADPVTSAWCAAQFWLGQLCGGASDFTGQGEAAVAWAVQARQVPGDRIPAWYARRIDSNLAWALVCSGEVDGVPELCDQLLAEARTVGDLSEQADTLFLMAVAALRGGRLAAARAELRASRPHGAAREPSTSPETGRLARCAVR